MVLYVVVAILVVSFCVDLEIPHMQILLAVDSKVYLVHCLFGGWRIPKQQGSLCHCSYGNLALSR